MNYILYTFIKRFLILKYINYLNNFNNNLLNFKWKPKNCKRSKSTHRTLTPKVNSTYC